MKKKFFAIFLLFVFILTSGFGCRSIDQATETAMQPITLNYWRVWDGPDAFEDVINDYKQLHPYVTINYRKLRYNEYEKELLDALAEDRGPDVFSIHNTWIRKYQNKIYPLPAKTSMVYQVTKGTIKKEIVPELRSSKSLTLPEIKNKFVDVVYDDVVVPVYDEKTETASEKVLGLPLSVDSLALFYNKDLFNNAGIPQAPMYWNKEFQDDVKKLTKQDGKGNISQAGVSLGGGENITRFSDILSVLMMQNGAVMIDDNGNTQFDQVPEIFRDQRYNPGLEALRFYTDFSNPAKEVYSWNKDMENSLDLFIKGKLAMMFGYSYFLPQIRSQAPKLNLGIAKLPQIEGNQQSVNFANYWVETVSSKSKNTDAAWDFLQFITSEAEAKKYLKVTNTPTALRGLVNSQIENKEADVFSEQVLTAKSWYKGVDSPAMEKIIADLIKTVANGTDKVENALSFAARQVQQTMEKKTNEE